MSDELVELLESALRGNTIACLGSGSSKVFLGLMVIREMSHQIRASLQEGGKRSVYLADTDEDLETLWSTLYHHTDLRVGKATCAETETWEEEEWAEFVNTHNILVLPATVFLNCLVNRWLTLSSMNLLVLDNCHLAVGDHAYVGIMSHVRKSGDAAPHLLCLTASILGNESSNPDELASKIASLESVLHSKAETSMLVISERFGCRPKESIVECETYEDTTGLGEELSSILYSTWHFLSDCQIKIEDHPGKSDPLHVPKFAISECINILQTLGPWCAASIAENLISQLEKIVKHQSNPTLKNFLRYTMTQLRLVVRVFEMRFTPEYVVEELLSYTTPKVREFVEILQKFKPEMDFMIITREGSEDDALSDMSDDDGNDGDDDSLDLSSSDDEEGKSGGTKHIHIAVKKRVERNDGDYPFDDEKKLCALVFVDNRYIAFALNKMIEEVCSWDENLCFVKSSHITGQGIHRPDGRKDLSKASRRQEEVLRKFRMQERNLLISTSVLEEGVDIPKCNLVVRFDPPRDYRSYTLSKGRARARDAEYVILVDEDLMEDFSEELQVFKGIEQVLIGSGRGRQDLEDAQEVQQLDKLQFTPLPPFCPLGQPGAPAVSMKNAIALVNRYCAKLPSDAFTHLTPHCRVCPSDEDPSQFIAYLRLPVNSPIKEEVMGVPMPSRQLAKMAVALKMCELLYKAGELDNQLQPVGKEMFVCEEEEEWEDDEDEPLGQARPGTTKRKQYYIKKPADAFVSSHPRENAECYLYQVAMLLTGPITEEQNTRGRKIYAPEETLQSFGVLLSTEIPHVPSFPVYTRSGEVTVVMELLRKAHYSEEQLEKLRGFHHFVFSSVLHLEKDPMLFSPDAADIGFIIVPLNAHDGSADLDIEWSFVDQVNVTSVVQKRNVFDGKRDVFCFEKEHFEDAVVMPSYRNIDQPQHFYVAEIRSDLSPLSPFPSPELYKTFAAYYTTKYGLVLTNMEQPLLDVDHTSARLNLLTPRYMNQKGRALPTSSLETKRARRENLQQKQILVPELCDIHVFSASLWRKAVCLPAILYRMNYLLLAEELRKLIAAATGIGKVNLDPDFRFPRLDFGFETNPEKLQSIGQNEDSDATPSSKESDATQSQSDDKKGEDAQVLCKTSQDESEQFSAKGASPEEEKCDTGASSDSDSGVVFSESDSTCLEGTDMSVSKPGCEDVVTHPQDEDSTERDANSAAHQEQELPYSSSDGTSPFIPSEPKSQVKKNSLQQGKSCQGANLRGATSSTPCVVHESSDAGKGFREDESPTIKTTSHKASDENCDTACQMHNQTHSQSDSSILHHLSSSSSSSSSLLIEDRSSSTLSPSVLQENQDSTVKTTLPPTLPHNAQISQCRQQGPENIYDISQHTGDAKAMQPAGDKKNDVLHVGVLSHDLTESNPCNHSCQKEMEQGLKFAKHSDLACSSSQESDDSSASFHAQESAKHSTSHTQSEATERSFQDADETLDSCDDFLDVTGSNSNHRTDKTFSTTFPVDPEISHFADPRDEVKLTFDTAHNLNSVGLDLNWSNTSGATSGKEWAPEETLTTFEVSGNMPEFADVQINSGTEPFDDAVLEKAGSETENPTADAKSTKDVNCTIQNPIELAHQTNDENQTTPSRIDAQKRTDETVVEVEDSVIGSVAAQVQERSVLQNETNNKKVLDESTSREQNGPKRSTCSDDKPALEEKEPADSTGRQHQGLVSHKLRKMELPEAELSSTKSDDCSLDKTQSNVCSLDETVEASPETGGFQGRGDTSDTDRSKPCDMSTEACSSSDTPDFTTDRFDIGVWNPPVKKPQPPSNDDADAEVPRSRTPISLDKDHDLETFVGPSPCLLLQALTMSNANDFFSLERLETIGDSFLKYAITVYLYCCYPGTHEGKLSYLRSKQVSNYNLYRLGRRKGLAERMVSTKFEPYENWLPPGYIISEDRRRGPVPKVVIATSNPKLSAAAPVNFVIEEEETEADGQQKRETAAFQQEVEEINRQQAVDEQNEISSSTKHAMVPYSLQLHHGIPDKSVADCVEALIGCYLTTCGKQAALTFMSWLGLKVLPRKRTVNSDAKRSDEVNMNEFEELQCPPSPLIKSVPGATDILNRLLEGFSEFESKINYTFRDRSYLLQAFTHASYHYNYITDCYQRLEFLGDAILDYVITRHLYEDSQRYSPGILTDLRSALVNNNIFAALAVKWDFHKYFKAISPSLFAVIDKFVVRQKDREDEFDEIDEVEEEEDEDEETAEEDGGGPEEDEVELEIPKALGDIFESVAGAIYLDSGMSLDTVWRVYYNMMKPHIDKYLKDIPKSPVRELLEMEPETAKFEKPERTLDGKIRVTVNVVGKGVFYGVGRNYRIAKSAAAKKALRFIRNLHSDA
nr:hypothetical protein BaRGS_023800 [Batillaria attramentaria]